MDWEIRLKALLLAGGTIAALGCTSSKDEIGNGACGNANPDPCICGRPEASDAEASLCDEEKSCQAQGGIFTYGNDVTTEPDGGTVTTYCELDAGSDAAP